MTNKNKVFLLIGLVLLSCFLLAPTFFGDKLPDWWSAKPVKLGLDLRGGSYLVLGVQTSEAVKSQMNTIAGSLKSELKKDRVGLIRSRAVGTSGIEVTLLGEAGIEKVREYMRKDYPEFSEKGVLSEADKRIITFEMSAAKVQEVEKNSVVQAIETIRNRVDQFGVAEPLIQKAGEKRIMVQLPDVTNLDSVKKTIGSIAKLEFRVVNLGQEGVKLKDRSGLPVYVEDEVLMTGDAIEKANVEIDAQTSEVQVSLRMNSLGKQTFARITTDYTEKQLAIILDGIVQSSPVIREPILGGTAQISGGFTKDEAHHLAVVLRSGALPAPLTFEEERTVGASLGADSIKKGIYSMLAGSAIVVVFMIFYYRTSGLIAVVALLLNIVFLLTLLSLFGATLTLPGLAGLALTVGMAVDANIVIFERIREELGVGASPMKAIEAGFDKAHWTILDSNITTLLAGIVLYCWGTGPIKGFAVTLCMGIFTTIFAALFVSRLGFAVLKIVNSKGELSI